MNKTYLIVGGVIAVLILVTVLCFSAGLPGKAFNAISGILPLGKPLGGDKDAPEVDPTPTSVAAPPEAVRPQSEILQTIDNGSNVQMTFEPNGYSVVVEYGMEVITAEGKEIPGCGTALIPDGQQLTIAIWAGTVHKVVGTLEQAATFASFVHNSRQGNANCQYWEVIGFTLSQ